MQATHRAIRPASLIGPLILIGLGVVFLLNNFGIATWNVWEAILQLWPVLLIAAGLEIIVGRRANWAAWLILIITIGVLGAGIWLLPRWNGSTIVGGQSITQPIGDATSARINIAFGAGTLRLKSVDDSANLVVGTIERRDNERVEQAYRLNGTTAIFSLTSKSSGTIRSTRQLTWDLAINQRIPADLTVSTGAGQTNLDLTALTLTRLDVNTGAGQTIMTLPQRGSFSAKVSAGVGEVRITVPEGMAARIHVTKGLGSSSVLGSFERQGEYYVSPGYTTAADRVDLDVSGGVGAITIREAGR